MRRNRPTAMIADVAAAMLFMFAAAAIVVKSPLAIQQGAGAMQAIAAEASTPLATSDNSAPLALHGDTTRVTLAPELKGENALADRLHTLAPQEQVYLVLEKLSISGATAIGYDVYFDLPEGAKPDAQSPNYVGNFNFFDAESGRRNAAFNITDLVRGLSRDGALGAAPTVTIVPTGQLEADAKPTIAKAVVIAVPQ